MTEILESCEENTPDFSCDAQSIKSIPKDSQIIDHQSSEVSPAVVIPEEKNDVAKPKRQGLKFDLNKNKMRNRDPILDPDLYVPNFEKQVGNGLAEQS